jgi:hypothetical protein
MAISVNIDEATHRQLRAKAELLGLSVSEYLARLAASDSTVEVRREHEATLDFDAELESLLFSGPALPADFSRADIYADHD